MSSVRNTNRPIPMPDGTRVRHGGQQYSRAVNFGTAVIVGHFWIGDHLEYRIRYDGSTKDTEWAYYSTHRAVYQD